MTESSYRIVFKGEIKPEYSPEQVKQNLSRLYKLPAEKFDKWFSGNHIRVKENIDRETGVKYLQTLARAGAICFLEIMPQPPSSESLQSSIDRSSKPLHNEPSQSPVNKTAQQKKSISAKGEKSAKIIPQTFSGRLKLLLIVMGGFFVLIFLIHLTLQNPQQEDDRQKLIEACTNGEYDKMIYWLKQGVDRNVQVNGVTCLMAAAGKGHVDLVEKLLALSANVELTDQEGNTALDYAVYYKHENIANIIMIDQDTKRIALLSEPERQQIFLDLAQRQKNNNDISDLLEKYSVTERQIDIIQQEGAVKNWPVAPPTPTSIPTPTATPNPEEIRKENIERQFSAWDGSHRNFVRYIKQNMDNPKSFEHVNTWYGDKGEYIALRMQFRGTNKFGALVLQECVAQADIEGNIIYASCE